LGAAERDVLRGAAFPSINLSNGPPLPAAQRCGASVDEQVLFNQSYTHNQQKVSSAPLSQAYTNGPDHIRDHPLLLRKICYRCFTKMTTETQQTQPSHKQTPHRVCDLPSIQPPATACTPCKNAKVKCQLFRDPALARALNIVELYRQRVLAAPTPQLQQQAEQDWQGVVDAVNKSMLKWIRDRKERLKSYNGQDSMMVSQDTQGTVQRRTAYLWDQGRGTITYSMNNLQPSNMPVRYDLDSTRFEDLLIRHLIIQGWYRTLRLWMLGEGTN
jgi:hypothetical protein